MPSTRGNHDFYSHGMSPPDGRKIVFGNVELGFSRVPSISRARRRMGSDAIKNSSTRARFR